MPTMLRVHNVHFGNAAMQQLHTRRRVKLMESFGVSLTCLERCVQPLRPVPKLPVMHKRARERRL